MDDKDKKHFTSLIQEQIKNLNQEIESLSKQIKPVSPDVSIGRLTRLDAMQVKSMNEANLSNAKMRLARLEAAASRVGTPEYGLCSRCEKPLPKKRLEILPESLICMDCLSEKE